MIRQLSPLSKGVTLSKYAALCTGTAFVMMSAMPAYALTASGSLVSNTVILTFDVGGVTQTPVESPTAEFFVDTMVDVDVTSNGDATVTPGQAYTTAVLSYTVTNEGNLAAGHGYALDIVYDTGTNSQITPMELSANDTPALGEYALYIDLNNDGLLDGGDTWYVAGGGTNAFDLVPDGTAKVLVVAGIPVATTAAYTGSYTVVAQTLDQGTTDVTAETTTPAILNVDTVFLDAESSDGAYTETDPLYNGIHSDVGVFTVSDTALSAEKTVRVINDGTGTPGCGADDVAQSTVLAELGAVPGACVEYTITVTKPLGTASTNVTLTDALPAGVTFAGIISSSSLLSPKTSDDFYGTEPGDAEPGEGLTATPSVAAGTVTATEATFEALDEELVLVIRATVD